MLRKILVVLDGSSADEFARRRAIEIGRRHGARLHGLGLLDPAWLAGPEPTPIGGTAFKQRRDAAVLGRARENLDAACRALRHACRDEGREQDFTCERVEGEPLVALRRRWSEHDLIVLGQRSSDTEGGFSLRTVCAMMRESPSPMLVAAPGEGVADEQIAIAYDGSPAATQSLRLFLRLGLAEGRRLSVISVDPEPQRAEALAGDAARLCARRGYRARPHGLPAAKAPAQVLLEAVERIRPGMVVMGAFGRRGLMSFLRGSSTLELVRRSRVPLFVHAGAA
jgi:nucleotide-binding universal stress UspA family protein